MEAAYSNIDWSKMHKIIEVRNDEPRGYREVANKNHKGSKLALKKKSKARRNTLQRGAKQTVQREDTKMNYTRTHIDSAVRIFVRDQMQQAVA